MKGLLVFFIVCVSALSVQYLISGVDDEGATNTVVSFENILFFAVKVSLGEMDAISSSAWARRHDNLGYLDIALIWIIFISINIIILFMVITNILIAQVGKVYTQI